MIMIIMIKLVIIITTIMKIQVKKNKHYQKIIKRMIIMITIFNNKSNVNVDSDISIIMIIIIIIITIILIQLLDSLP